MKQIKITVTVDTATGLTARDIGRFIQRATSHVDNPPIEVTSTVDTIDIRFEKTFSEIAITGDFFTKLEVYAKEHNTTIDEILQGGARRYGYEVKDR